MVSVQTFGGALPQPWAWDPQPPCSLHLLIAFLHPSWNESWCPNSFLPVPVSKGLPTALAPRFLCSLEGPHPFGMPTPPVWHHLFFTSVLEGYIVLTHEPVDQLQAGPTSKLFCLPLGWNIPSLMGSDPQPWQGDPPPKFVLLGVLSLRPRLLYRVSLYFVFYHGLFFILIFLCLTHYVISISRLNPGCYTSNLNCSHGHKKATSR